MEEAQERLARKKSLPSTEKKQIEYFWEVKNEDYE